MNITLPLTLLENPIFRNPNCLHILIYLIRNADNGLIAAPRRVLAKSTGLTEQNVKSALKGLEKEELITTRLTQSVTQTPTQSNTRKNHYISITNHTIYLKGSPIGNPNVIPIKKARKKKAVAVLEVPFEDFWSIYPKQTKETLAKAAWKSAKIDLATFELIKLFLVDAWPDRTLDFKPNPVAFIKEKQWLLKQDNSKTNVQKNNDVEVAAMLASREGQTDIFNNNNVIEGEYTCEQY